MNDCVMKSGIVQIGDQRVPYTVRVGPDLKHVHLKLKPNLKLEVSIPGHSHVDVDRLLRKKKDWIDAKYKEIVHSKRTFNGKKVLYQGHLYEVQLVAWHDGPIRPEKGRI